MGPPEAIVFFFAAVAGFCLKQALKEKLRIFLNRQSERSRIFQFLVGQSSRGATGRLARLAHWLSTLAFILSILVPLGILMKLVPHPMGGTILFGLILGVIVADILEVARALLTDIW